MSVPKRVLTIAGSDSGGGAGIEADLKTFAALGAYGMAAVTAVTAQNTVAVTAVHDVPAQLVAAQIDAVATDLGVDACKTGMLSNAEIVLAVCDALSRLRIEPVVVDPVMVAESGARLLHNDAVAALIEWLLPLATVLTPNMPEAETLTGATIRDEVDLRRAAERLHEMGARNVLMKGGHMQGAESVDYLFDGATWTAFRAPRLDTRSTHGTGCTYSAALAVFLAQGLEIADAVRAAKRYLTGAMRHGLPFGAGAGPLDHGWTQK
ncbi:MAG: bifunctional hydroxymethylpyrimidine kinase/phosphomethylpyrimidine kinase [Candidatus Hydrogenedentales bacterium]